MAAGNGGAGQPPEHFEGADGATTENGKHPRREYKNLALEASDIGLARAGPAAGEEGHGATDHSVGRLRDEEGDERPQRVRLAYEHDEGETEERGPPNGRARLT